jgi:hypothetical protein
MENPADRTAKRVSTAQGVAPAPRKLAKASARIIQLPRFPADRTARRV